MHYKYHWYFISVYYCCPNEFASYIHLGAIPVHVLWRQVRVNLSAHFWLKCNISIEYSGLSLFGLNTFCAVVKWIFKFQVFSRHILNDEMLSCILYNWTHCVPLCLVCFENFSQPTTHLVCCRMLWMLFLEIYSSQFRDAISTDQFLKFDYSDTWKNKLNLKSFIWVFILHNNLRYSGIKHGSCLQ